MTYSGRTNLSTKVNTVQVATDLKRKEQEAASKLKNTLLGIDSEEKRNAAKTRGDFASLKGNQASAQTSLKLWAKAHEGVMKGVEGYIERKKVINEEQQLSGFQFFEENPVKADRLLADKEVMSALRSSQKLNQETASKLQKLGLDEIADKYVEMGKYARRGFDFAAMQNEVHQADRKWPEWLQQNTANARQWNIGDGEFGAENFNKLLPSQQSAILTSFGNEITENVPKGNYSASVLEANLYKPLRKWKHSFLDEASQKSNIFRSIEHIKNKELELFTSIETAKVDGNWDTVQAELSLWRDTTKYQYEQLEFAGHGGGKNAGELQAEGFEALLTSLLDKAALGTSQDVDDIFENLIKPVLTEEQFELIPNLDSKGKPRDVPYRRGKQILPFGDSLSDHPRFNITKWELEVAAAKNRNYDATSTAIDGATKKAANDFAVGYQKNGDPGLEERTNDFVKYVTENPAILNHPTALTTLRENTINWKSKFVNDAQIITRLETLHTTKGKIWTAADMEGLELDRDAVQDFMSTYGITLRETHEWGTGLDKNIIENGENRIKKALGQKPLIGFDTNEGEAIATTAWAEVRAAVQQEQATIFAETGRWVSDSSLLEKQLQLKLEEITTGSQIEGHRYQRTPEGFKNFSAATRLNKDVYSPQFTATMNNYRRIKTEHGGHPSKIANQFLFKDNPNLVSMVDGEPHPVLSTIARDLGILPIDLYNKQLKFKEDGEPPEDDKLYSDTKTMFGGDTLLGLGFNTHNKIDFNRTIGTRNDFICNVDQLKPFGLNFTGDTTALLETARAQGSRGKALRWLFLQGGGDPTQQDAFMNNVHSSCLYDTSLK